MAKFTSIAAILITMLVVVQASIFKTIVTTTIEEEGTNSGQGQQGSSQSQRCMQQIQQQQRQLQNCQRFLQQSMAPEQLSMVTDDEDFINPRQQQEQQQQQQQRQLMRECCNGLQNIRDEQCRCQAVKQVAQRVQEQGQGQHGRQGQGQGQQMQQMLERAMNLPAMCNLEPRQCQIRSLLF